MANFEMNNFLNEYQTYNARKYTAAENGLAAMEARQVANAQEAIASEGLLSLTLGEKLSELGLGKRVVQQLGETAKGAVEEIVSPIKNYLEKYENIFDERVYNTEMQAMGSQMFFTRQALTEEAASGQVGQRFVFDM